MEPVELILTFNCVKEQNVKKNNNLVRIVHVFDYLIFDEFTSTKASTTGDVVSEGYILCGWL